MRKTYLLLPLLALASAPAHAELPEPVRAMIEAAIATGEQDTVKAVTDVARTTNPDDATEIDAMLGIFETEQAELAAVEAQAEEMAIRQAGLFDNWSGQGQIGGFQTTGNTDSVGLSAQLDLAREGINWEHNFKAAVDYRRSNGVTDREQFMAAYEPHYQINDRLFAYALAQWERDRFQGYSGRYALSGGLGYKLVDTDSMQLRIKAGPAWRRTEFINGGSTSNLAALFGADFDWKIADNIKLTQDTNATSELGGSAQAIVGGDNISLNVVTGLEAGISDRLSARLSYAVEYDSEPPAGAVSTDTITRFTLIYGF